ncbi:programmed cell death protein 2 [Chondrus crispus]|uniref:Programmed cell death protein 2 n=1 Tax=Chondrus crispus TaxID=2769 RepID=R7Q4A2_CHOCR|nr:programmed cell death protein 2 [Chondrus crispus]CDF32839.1 programmed cell death protein 2 [Chondrus crispus]|eukprot:XP_005712640.1 programmed cell death protein 2 [Chondrus crispus]
MLYVAICPSASCQRRSDCVTVLRAQLPQRNQCYPYEAVEEPELIKEPDVCVLCGFAAAKRCAQCHRVSYCARACQLQDWKLGHKDECAGGVTKDDMDARRVKCRLREMEIVTEQHPTPDTSDDEDDSEGEDAHVETLSPNGDASEGGGEQEDAKAETLPPSGDAHPSGTVTRVSTAVNVDEMPVRGTFQDADGDELPEEIFRGRGRGLGANDASTSHFQRVVGYASSQVVRYEWDGLALWAARGGRCGEAGACQRCGAPRVFEMQVMPQLAWYVRHDDARATIEAVAERLRDGMEWATIAVYSCSRSCPLGDVYAREMAWAQAFDAPP